MNKRLKQAAEEREEKDEEWREVLDICDEMLFDEEYEFASDTIQGIRDWIEENSAVTPAQKRAVLNIRDSI